jgi:hypothetical protein
LPALAPCAGEKDWSRHDLRHWVGLTEQVTDDQIESALTLATAWGATYAD